MSLMHAEPAARKPTRARLSVTHPTTNRAIVRAITRLHFSTPEQPLLLTSWNVPPQAASLQVLIIKPTPPAQPTSYVGFLNAATTALEARTGTLLCKLADWRASVDFVNACRQAGWSLCAMVPTFGAPFAPHCYWICAHPGPRCRAEGIRLWDICLCGARYTPRRRDQRTCGRAKCRRSRPARPGHAARASRRVPSTRYGKAVAGAIWSSIPPKQIRNGVVDAVRHLHRP